MQSSTFSWNNCRIRVAFGMHSSAFGFILDPHVRSQVFEAHNQDAWHVSAAVHQALSAGTTAAFRSHSGCILAYSAAFWGLSTMHFQLEQLAHSGCILAHSAAIWTPLHAFRFLEHIIRGLAPERGCHPGFLEPQPTSPL